MNCRTSGQLRLSPSDRFVLQTLTWKVRVAARQQLATVAELPRSRATLQRRLNRLAAARLIQLSRQSLVLLVLRAPLYTWLPAEQAPDFGRLAWKLQRRWRAGRRQRVTFLWATRQAERLLGGAAGRGRQPLQVQHDLAAAAVYFHKLRSCPAAAECWIGEDAFRRCYDPRGRSAGKTPDAVELDGHGQIIRVIEIGGLYSADRLRKFHVFWSSRHLSYELW